MIIDDFIELAQFNVLWYRLNLHGQLIPFKQGIKIVTSSRERVGIIQTAKANLVDDLNRIQLHTEFRKYYFYKKYLF